MSATAEPTGRATGATVQLNWKLFDERAEAAGARTETAKADIMGVTRETLWRYRRADFSPGLDIVLRTAKALDVTLDDLVVTS